jgi:hypothetical protein
MPEIPRSRKASAAGRPLLLARTERRRAAHAALRLVWNARGGADIATLEATVPDTISFKAGGFVKQLDRALRGLDR